MKTIKGNDRGSTLITVLVVVAFIAILGTVSTSMAMINYKMKMVDKKSKATFYTAEEAVDEIYTGLGITSMKCLDESYKQEMARLIKQQESLGISYRESNKTCNLNMRNGFTKKFLYEIFESEESSEPNLWNTYDTKTFETDAYKNALKNHLNSYLSAADKASVQSVGTVNLTKTTSSENGIAVYSIRISDCVVEYVKDSDGYFAGVTFDCVMQLPDTMVKFTEDSGSSMSSLNTYNIVGNTGIKVNASKKLILNNASAYAGGGAVSEGTPGGFNLAKESAFNVNKSIIVTTGDVTVDSATFNVDGVESDNSRIWCKNLIVKNTSKDISPKVTINNCQTFVKDDLQVDGSGVSSTNRAEVTVNGEYYGYSYEGNNSSNSHNASSSISVNGSNTKLDLSGIKYMMLGGRSYIDFNATDTYMLGQSLALKGDQEAYLVPSSLLKDKNNESQNLPNPFPKTSDCTVDAKNFFGYTCLDLSDTANNSYIKKVTVGNKCYVYFVFSSKEASAKYFKAIFNDSVYQELVVLGGASGNAALRSEYDSTRAHMKNILETNMISLSQSIKGATGANIYTNGALISADSDSKTVGLGDSSSSLNVNGYGTYDGFGLNSMDLSNRYTYLCRLLYEPSWTKADGKRNIQYSTSDLASMGATGTVFNNVINDQYIISQKTKGSLYSNSVSGGFVKIISDGNVTITDSMKYGVVVALGDVTVNTSEFHGLILSNGMVIFANDSTVIDGIIPGSSTIEEYIKSDSEFAMYFKKYNESEYADNQGIPFSISDVTYKDIIHFQNWRKNG